MDIEMFLILILSFLYANAAMASSPPVSTAQTTIENNGIPSDQRGLFSDWIPNIFKKFVSTKFSADVDYVNVDATTNEPKGTDTDISQPNHIPNNPINLQIGGSLSMVNEKTTLKPEQIENTIESPILSPTTTAKPPNRPTTAKPVEVEQTIEKPEINTKPKPTVHTTKSPTLKPTTTKTPSQPTTAKPATTKKPTTAEEPKATKKSAKKHARFGETEEEDYYYD